MKTVSHLALEFLYFCLSFASKETFTKSYPAGISQCSKTPNSQPTPLNDKAPYCPNPVLAQSLEANLAVEGSKSPKCPAQPAEDNYGADLTQLAYPRKVERGII